MQALHDSDDTSRTLVVEAAIENLVIEGTDVLAFGRRIHVAGLAEIVNDDEIGAKAGHCTTHRDRRAPAATGGNEIELLQRPDPGPGKSLPIEWTFHDAVEIAGMVFGKLVAVARDQELGVRPVSKDKGRKGNTDGDGFEIAWRNVGNDIPLLAGHHILKNMTECLEIGALVKLCIAPGMQMQKHLPKEMEKRRSDDLSIVLAVIGHDLYLFTDNTWRLVSLGPRLNRFSHP